MQPTLSAFRQYILDSLVFQSEVVSAITTVTSIEYTEPARQGWRLGFYPRDVDSLKLTFKVVIKTG